MKPNKPGGVSKHITTTLLISSLVSCMLLAIRVSVTGSVRLSFLVWNLFLAWLPLFFALWLTTQYKNKNVPSYKEIIIWLLWLGFLPNSFYLISDFIHLQSSGEVGLLYDTAMISSFVLNGLLLGYISLYLVHKLMKQYFGSRVAYFIAQAVLLLSAFAIYLGRYLRWNTWDIVLNPLGLAFDVSERIINPGSYAYTFVVTGVFYALLGSLYAVLYSLAQTFTSVKKR